MQADPSRILLGERFFSEMKMLVCQKLKLSASTCQAVFILANQQGQGRGHQWSFAVSLVCGRSSAGDARAQGCSHTVPTTQSGHTHQLRVSIFQRSSPKINQRPQISSLFEAH